MTVSHDRSFLDRVTDELLAESLAAELSAGATRRDAAATVAARFGVAPNRVKRLATDS